MTYRQIKKIVLTGGPCAGKSTFVDQAVAMFEPYGIKVLVAREAAGIVIYANADSRLMGTSGKIYWHHAVISIQMALEDNLLALAKGVNWGCEKVLILCDRGSLDSKGFCNDSEWQSILAIGNWEESLIRERYDEVIMLQSVAHLGEQLYSRDDNTARLEDPGEAVLADKRLLEAWGIHPKFSLISSNADFELKLAQVKFLICNSLGL